ncbi:MAG TPA: uroporphyrinogen-III synthase [Ilumatobacter sp.]|nr:uroporphyrinogen-III synthase [Ilumatobacter sp.]
MTARQLAGFRIGVTADRRADEQIGLLESRGAACLHGPVIKTHPQDSQEAMRLATQELIDRPPDVLVLTTGLGVRSWLEAADSIQLGNALHELFHTTALYARGPKATGALVTAGFDVLWTAPRARYDDVIDVLTALGVGGIRIGVQLDGAGASELCDTIESLGAEVVRVPVYRWSLPDDLAPAERLIRAVVERKLDAVTFTAKPAVENFFDIAHTVGCYDDIVDALSTDVAPFCVGPVCATGLTNVGIPAPHIPERHRLGSLVQLLSTFYADRCTEVVLGGTPMSLQGRMATIGTDVAWLTERERALLVTLLERKGAVVSKRDLLRTVWQGTESDEHLVEVTVARLRKRLGPASMGIETVMRRGYRATIA